MGINNEVLLKATTFLLFLSPWCIFSADPTKLSVEMTLVDAPDLGAVCLDGSLPGYHIHEGSGEGAGNWLLSFEGGAWCNDIKSCTERAPTYRGSTNHMTKYKDFNGILSNNPTNNPDFYNWNRVKLRYCDGGSFSGDAKVENGPTVLHFKGEAIWEAIIRELLPKGLGQAKKAFLMGCSAGGLSAFLHCDDFAKVLPKDAELKCMSDGGFFMDVMDVSSTYTQRSFYEKLITLQGMEKNLPANCIGASPDPKQCIFPQHILKYISTPFFVLNSAYDVFQFKHILVPPSSDKKGEWSRCKEDPAKCTPAQIDVLQGFRRDMLAALEPFQGNSTTGGLFINSCFAHCQSELQDTWLAADSPRVNGKTIAEAVGDWYFNRKPAKEIDCPYPCSKTCHNLIPELPSSTEKEL